MAPQTAQSPRHTFFALFSGAGMRKQASQGRQAAPMASAKLADRAAAAADAWSIPAVQCHGSVCTDAAHQAECMDMTAYPAAPASPASEPVLEGSAASTAGTTATTAALPTLDLEITAEEAQWLVQPPALSEAPAPIANQPAASSTTACSSRQAAPAPSRPAAAPLAALRHGLRRLAGRLRRRLAAAACMERPATLECGGCPGRRLGNASSGASAEWTVVHVNWS